jgi:uncharacterized protein YdhG (YjbR/CyaY superfamily)
MGRMSTTTAKKAPKFTPEERAAMKERARELKAEAEKSDGLADVRAKIAAMSSPDRERAQRVHDIVTKAAPELTPKTWYGMPAYYKDGRNICFYKAAEKFNVRYAELGFSDPAKLDDGLMWPTAYALTELTPEVEAEIAALVKKAAR